MCGTDALASGQTSLMISRCGAGAAHLHLTHVANRGSVHSHLHCWEYKVPKAAHLASGQLPVEIAMTLRLLRQVPHQDVRQLWHRISYLTELRCTRRHLRRYFFRVFHCETRRGGDVAKTSDRLLWDMTLNIG